MAARMREVNVTRFVRLPTKKDLFNLEITARAARIALRSSASPPLALQSCPTDIFLCIVDHYEPQLGRAPRVLAQERVEDWLRRYPQIASAHADAEGRPPAHSFFYPWDEYDAWELERLAALCGEGFGEIEIHLHHHDDTDATVRQKFRDAVRVYWEQGALTKWPDGRIAWGFIHGNWALDNSRCEQSRNYCGVNNELDILQEEGCYADFTFPAWQHTAQPRQINSIYYATDDPVRPKSYDTGTRARAGVTDTPGLLLIPGPLVPFWRKGGKLPRPAMDDSDLAAYRRYDSARLDRWVRAGIHVANRPDRIFIKLHCHGAEERNRHTLLGSDLDALFTDAEARYNDGKRYRLHYLTAREMFNVVKATEAGIADIETSRDWLLPPPAMAHQRQQMRSRIVSSLAIV